jgi:hypothetical protein
MPKTRDSHKVYSLAVTLYKYRQDNTYTEQIFSTRQVWLSTADQLNDPFECTIHDIASDWIREKVRKLKAGHVEGFFVGLAQARSRGELVFGKPVDELLKMLPPIKQESDFDRKYELFRQLHKKLSGGELSRPGEAFDTLEAQLQAVGIFSLSELPDHPLMWAHYGDQHKGIAIGFHATAPGSKLSDPEHCLKVNYSDSVPVLEAAGGLRLRSSMYLGDSGPYFKQNLSFNDSALQAAISTKSTSWSYEQEWRYVEEAGGHQPWPGTITEVIFGLKCPWPRRMHYFTLAAEYVPNPVSYYEIVKVPNTNSVRRRLLSIGAI